MASSEAEAVKRLYRGWLTTPAERPDWSLDDQRDLVEGWNVLTTEPGGSDYLETDAGGVPAMWAVPHGSHDDRVLYCIHGGGYITGSMYTHRKLFAHLAKALGVRALIVNYRLLPEVTYPGPLDDVVSGYRWLLEQEVDAERIAFIGDSVGGALAVTSQLRGRDEDLPLPSSAMLISPWVDMEVTGDSMVSNDHKDVLFSKAWVAQMANDYLAGHSPQDPHANPLHADLQGLAPMYIQVGGDEVLLDDSRRLALRAEQAGIDVRLDVFPEQQHTFQMMAGRAPEADDAVTRLADWVRPRLGL